MESLCLRSGRWMSPAVCDEMKRSYLVLRTCLNSLACRAFDESVLRYHVRPKLHFLGHLVYHYQPRNPRHMACFLDEDFVARTKRLAESCHPVYMSQQVTFRYALHLSLKMSGLIKWKSVTWFAQWWAKGKRRFEDRDPDQHVYFCKSSCNVLAQVNNFVAASEVFGPESPVFVELCDLTWLHMSGGDMLKTAHFGHCYLNILMFLN